MVRKGINDDHHKLSINDMPVVSMSFHANARSMIEDGNYRIAPIIGLAKDRETTTSMTTHFTKRK
jgi:hypothetical protein